MKHILTSFAATAVLALLAATGFAAEPHLLKNFPQFVVIHIVKGFGIVSKAEVDVFLELSCFLDDPMDVGNLISGSSAFSKSSFHLEVHCSRIVRTWLG